MAGYRVVVDVTGMSSPDARRAARRLKRIVERHEGFIRRTGNLSRSTFVQYYNPMKLIIVGARAEYASYLNEGTWKITGKPYIEDAVREVLPDASIVRVGKIDT